MVAEQDYTMDWSLDTDDWIELPVSGRMIISVVTGPVTFRIDPEKPHATVNRGIFCGTSDIFKGTFNSKVWVRRSVDEACLIIVYRAAQRVVVNANE